MKEQLNRENIEALAAYRFQRAEETLREIPYLKQLGYYNTTMQSKLFWGAFNAPLQQNDSKNFF